MGKVDANVPATKSILMKGALSALLAAAPKKHKDLRELISSRLSKVSDGDNVSADESFDCFKGACEKGPTKLIVCSLGGIEKLIAGGLIDGRGADIFTNDASRCLMDSIVETISKVAEQNDDEIQLHAVRALLAAVMSPFKSVHGTSLMNVVRTCFQIHKESRKDGTQTTAQSALSQMLQMVTQRMESFQVEVHVAANSVPGMPSIVQSSTVVSEPPVVQESGTTETKVDSSEGEADARQYLAGAYMKRLVDDAVVKIDGDSATNENGDPKGKFGWCVVCRKAAPHYCLDTKDPVCSAACKSANLSKLNSIASKIAPSSIPTPATTASPVQPQTAVYAVSSANASNNYNVTEICKQDVLMVFRSLCKLAVKDTIPPGQQSPDPRMVKAKTLSLELLLAMLHAAGPVLRDSEEFHEALKSHLVIALLTNSVSPVPKIFVLSLQIFFIIMSGQFKSLLLKEIGIFIEQVFLCILESVNSSFTHKQKVMQVFYKICTDAPTALEIFVNFDCNVKERNVFERSINCLAKIAQGKYAQGGGHHGHTTKEQLDQESELRKLALEALVTLLGSVVEWSRRHMNANHPSYEETNGQEDDYSVDDLAVQHPQQHSDAENQKIKKTELEICIRKFNAKPHKGMEEFIKRGFCSGTDSFEVAKLLLTMHDLEKTAIGEYLGENDDFSKRVLGDFTDLHNFQNLDLVEGLRKFLSSFRLPGEAQKIDRIVERFAEKFYHDNPDSQYASADCAYVLSYSVIMLNTDLHSSQVRKKMTVDDFITNNRGINSDQDLPNELFETLYKAILKNPISLREDDDLRIKQESATQQMNKEPKRRFELFLKETESIVQRSKEILRQQNDRHSVASSSPSAISPDQQRESVVPTVEHVRPLFEVITWPMLATFSVLLETNEDQQVNEWCVEGFKHCIRIACKFDLDTEKDALISSIAKFTGLMPLKDKLKAKNLACIRALLYIGMNEGNALSHSWKHVLFCASQVERLLTLAPAPANGAVPASRKSSNMGNASPVASGGSGLLHQGTRLWVGSTGQTAVVAANPEHVAIEQYNSRVLSENVNMSEIEMLFARSIHLSPSAILEFVTQLCAVSAEEMSVEEQPRLFSLQKLVEVADFNMNRIRLVWSKLWKSLSAHFITITTVQSKNSQVCMFAMDSLRQLAVKFLGKSELSNFHFQLEVLRPFETVMAAPTTMYEVQEFILSIISSLISNSELKLNIKSGWITILHILSLASASEEESIVNLGMNTLEYLHADNLKGACFDNHRECVKTIVGYCQCQLSANISLRGLKLLNNTIKFLSEVPLASTINHPAILWLPVLHGVSSLVCDERIEVRRQALQLLFKTLRSHANSGKFESDTLQMIFRGVIHPLFDDVLHHCRESSEDSESLDQEPTTSISDQQLIDDDKEEIHAQFGGGVGPSTCAAALRGLVDMIDSNFDSLYFLYSDVLAIFASVINHSIEAVAKAGVASFKDLLIKTGTRSTSEMWSSSCATISKLLKSTTPKELIPTDSAFSDEVTDGDSLWFNSSDVVTKCVTQLLLIDLILEITNTHMMTGAMPDETVWIILESLECSYLLAREYNSNIPLRQKAKKLGFMSDLNKLPGLLRQERESLTLIISILFRKVAALPADSSNYSQRLKLMCQQVKTLFVDKENDAIERHHNAQNDEVLVELERQLTGLHPIICDVMLNGFVSLPDDRFSANVDWIYQIVTDLVLVDSLPVRRKVKEVLLDSKLTSKL